MTKTEKAEATVSGLEDKRRALANHAIELAEERQRVSFAAHTGDAKARQRLDKISAEHSAHESEMASLEAAILEAQARLNVVRAAEAIAQDRAAALQLRGLLAEFVELGEEIDAAFADITAAATQMRDVLSRMHGLGARSPSHDQLRVLGTLALKTALMDTPWAKEFEHLAPNQRRSFAALVRGWHDQLAPSIEARIGEKQEEAA
jgi:hypothetical protein